MRVTFLGSGIALIVAAGVMLTVNQQSEAKGPLGKTWPASQQKSMGQIDHSTYDQLLKKHVDEDGFVDYQAWYQSQTDRRLLQQYLAQLSQANPDLQASREARLAFWINAYNAVTIEGILQEYPTDSIRNHTSKLGGYNIWHHLPLLVGGKKYSLNEMEHEVLRKMGEPRIHFAIVCASVGCPRLLNEAYTADKLEEQLTRNTKDFFQRPQNFSVDRNGTIYLSSIIDWFGEDFGKNQQQRLEYLAPYFPEYAQKHAVSGRANVKFKDYNWSLNDQARKPATIGKSNQSGSGTK